MSTAHQSASAYDKLSKLTDQYDETQARLQELRVLARAMRVLAVTYCREDNVELPMGVAIASLTTAASVERNRLYVEASRLVDQMTRLNALIQNGVYDDVQSEAQS